MSMNLPTRNFFDLWGNVLPNSWDTQSENPTTFNVAYTFSLQYNIKLSQITFDNMLRNNLNKYFMNKMSWRTMENDPNSDWSIDERQSMLAFFNFFNLPNRVDMVPLVMWDSFANFRPDVLAYSAYVKYKWLPEKVRNWCREVIIDQALISCREFAANPKKESSGAQLAFIKLYGIKEIKALNQCAEIVGGWPRVFEHYYPEEDHPTRLAWQ